MSNFLSKFSLDDNAVYKCIMNYDDEEFKVHYKIGDLLTGKELEKINKLNRMFFELVGSVGITYTKLSSGTLAEIVRDEVDVCDVFELCLDDMKKQTIAVIDISEDKTTAFVYPPQLGSIPISFLKTQRKLGWLGVNYDIDWSRYASSKTKKETEKL